MALRRIAFTQDDTVFMTLAIDDSESPKHEMWVAGLVSDPKLIEITDDNIDFGGKLVNGAWVAPQ